MYGLRHPLLLGAPRFSEKGKKTLVMLPFRRRHHFWFTVLVVETFFHPFAICEDI